MARLYADENFPTPVAVALRRLGHDILTSHEAGRSGQAIPDDLVLDFAVAERRAVLTINRKHFIRLHKERPGHAGILVCTFDSDFIRQAVRIDGLLESNADLNGILIRVNRPVR